MEVKNEIKNKGSYLYCIFYRREDIPTICKGIDGKNEVFSIPYRDINALVSQIPLDEYSEEHLERNLTDIRWVAPRVKIHERIIEHIMDFSPVIPVKFCTIFGSKDSIQEILEKHYDSLKSLLDYLVAKEEWGIKVYVEPDVLSSAVAGLNPEIKKLNERITTASPGEAFFLRKKRDSLLREETDRVLDELADEIYERLLSLSVQGSRGKLFDKKITGKNDETILNAALLLKKEDIEGVKAEINKIASRYEEKGIYFELSGPWPPYNFCSSEQISSVIKSVSLLSSTMLQEKQAGQKP